MDSTGRRYKKRPVNKWVSVFYPTPNNRTHGRPFAMSLLIIRYIESYRRTSAYPLHEI